MDMLAAADYKLSDALETKLDEGSLEFRGGDAMAYERSSFACRPSKFDLRAPSTSGQLCDQPAPGMLSLLRLLASTRRDTRISARAATFIG
jgi:hypothetical protein